MRVGSIVALLAVLVTAATASPAAAASPALRLGQAPGLAVIGTGFRPRTLVTLRVLGHDVERRATVRVGVRGGFVVRFPEIDRCSPTVVVARTASGRSVGIPAWRLSRDCLPPPPVAPGVTPN